MPEGNRFRPSLGRASGAVIPALTGVRAVAALIVVLYHQEQKLYGERFFSRGFLGVDLFFCLSGFVLMLSYGGKLGRDATLRDVLDFLWRRLARIYPLHVFMLALFLMRAAYVGNLWEGESLSVGSLCKSLLLVHSWGTCGQLVWNGVSWSISAEWFAYVAFPVALILIRRFACGIIPAVLWCGLLLTWFVVVAWGAVEDWSLDQHYSAFSLVRVSIPFALGAAASVVWLRYGMSISCSNGLFLVCSLWIGLAIFGGFPDVLVVAALPVFLVVISVEGGVAARLLSRPMLVWGGSVSYALYLSHDFTYWAFSRVERLLGSAVLDPGILRLVVVVVMHLFVSYFLWLLIERPAHRWMLRRSRSVVGEGSCG